MRRFVLTLTLLGLAGCGSSSGGDADTLITTPLTAEQTAAVAQEDTAVADEEQASGGVTPGAAVLSGDAQVDAAESAN